MMDEPTLLTTIAGLVAASTPLVFAVLGETVTERAGVINLSLNGLILLAAMAGFAVAVTTNNLLLGFIAGAAVGAAIAGVLAFVSITLLQSQVAVGFVLMIICRDLAYFLGAPFTGRAGPCVPPFPIPKLCDIPWLGPLFFRQDLPTYAGFLLWVLVGLWMYRTLPGVILRGLGERPEAAYARGAAVNRLRYVYALAGGALAGLAGPMYSLNVKAGWMGTISGLDGIGWIALAITVFGGWNPIRAVLGVYLFTFLQWLGLFLQARLPNVPVQVLQVAPFPLMILTLLLVNVENTEWVQRALARLPDRPRHLLTRALRFLRATPPAALGQPFTKP